MPSRFPPRRPPLPRWAGSAAPPPLPGPGSSLAPGLSSSSSPNSPPPLCLFFLFPLPLFLLSVRLSARGTASNAGSLPYGAPPGLEGPPRPRPAAPQHAAAAALRGSGSRSLPGRLPPPSHPLFFLSLFLLPPTHSAGERDRPGTTPMNNPHRLARRGRSGAGGRALRCLFPSLPRITPRSHGGRCGRPAVFGRRGRAERTPPAEGQRRRRPEPTQLRFPFPPPSGPL